MVRAGLLLSWRKNRIYKETEKKTWRITVVTYFTHWAMGNAYTQLTRLKDSCGLSILPNAQILHCDWLLEWDTDRLLRVNHWVPNANYVLFPYYKLFIEPFWPHVNILYTIYIYDVFSDLSRGSNHEKCLHDNCFSSEQYLIEEWPRETSIWSHRLRQLEVKSKIIFEPVYY